jgi:hypothetical protein
MVPGPARSAQAAKKTGDSGRANDPTVLILTSLAAGEKHGYALLQDIEAFAGVRLGPGTLYGAISRLEDRGLIEPMGAAARGGRGGCPQRRAGRTFCRVTARGLGPPERV